MASLAEFLSMPLSGGPNARPFGVDELGNTAFRGVLGPDYRVVQQAPNRESVVRGLLSQIMDAPGATLANLAKGAAQGTWDAISAPGRSWSDSTMTYGDVANTAGLVSLPAVAGKYDPAVANMGLRYTRPEGDDFRGWHKAPGRGADNGTFDNLSSIYPDDIYDRRVAAQYYGHGGEPWERSTIDSFAAARGNPDAEVMVYRAVPEGIDDIFAGDWVTPNRAYAEMHGNSWVDDGKYKILAENVRAGDLYTDANSIHEFGWDPPPRIRAYHGSPHDFDRFDLSKIGTGEGAQAYGHGLYFAEAEDVAKDYKKRLASYKETPSEGAAIVLRHTEGDRAEAVRRARAGLESTRANNFDDGGQQVAKWEEIVRILEDPKVDVSTLKEPGRMYEVDINADPNDFLDWDAPLSEQPAKVRDITDGIGITPEIEGRRVYEAVGTVEGWKPGHVNNRVSELAADKFREAGIPGIKYYDQGSRASGQGTRNYVVFDDSLIEILRKYGLAGAMLGFGAYPQENSQ